MDQFEFVIPIFLFTCTAAVLIVWLLVRHRERMNMVEKGLSAEDIKAMYARDIKRDPLSSLKWGMLFVLGGLAVMLGNFLVQRYDVEPGIVIGMVILFVGIGLVLFYTIATKKMNP
ncbi:MAG: hypothetical protein HY707_12545 [Ignavibacteriae bacterium]|nr:hypothetical protein [Ignavibacteriota bacterium]